MKTRQKTSDIICCHSVGVSRSAFLVGSGGTPSGPQSGAGGSALSWLRVSRGSTDHPPPRGCGSWSATLRTCLGALLSREIGLLRAWRQNVRAGAPVAPVRAHCELPSPLSGPRAAVSRRALHTSFDSMDSKDSLSDPVIPRSPPPPPITNWSLPAWAAVARVRAGLALLAPNYDLHWGSSDPSPFFQRNARPGSEARRPPQCERPLSP